MVSLFSIVGGVFGLVIGSFLTVVVHRFHAGGTIVTGRSHCVHCKKTLRWFELIPVASFLIQRGRCRSCGGRIPTVYPFIELLTALSFAAIAWGVVKGTLAFPPEPLFVSPGSGVGSFGALGTFALLAYFAASAAAVSFYDFLHKEIPMQIIWLLAIVGFAAHALVFARSGDSGTFLVTLAVAAAFFALFWCLWFFSRGRAMGRGDADVALAIALVVGPVLAVVSLLLAFWSGAIFGILALLLKKLGWKSAIPFAPFLLGGAFAALYLVDTIQSLGYFWIFR